MKGRRRQKRLAELTPEEVEMLATYELREKEIVVSNPAGDVVRVFTKVKVYPTQTDLPIIIPAPGRPR